MKILAIGAHPDDIEYSCLGFLLAQKKKGAIIDYLIMTLGEKGNNENGQERREEQLKAFDVCGFNLIEFGNYTDGCLPVNSETISFVEKKISTFKPDIILTHYPKDWHQDHVSTSAIVQAACRNYPKLLFYNSYSSIEFTPKIFYDISDYIEQKKEILSKFRTQIERNASKGIDFAGYSVDVNKYFGNQCRKEYAEAFDAYRFLL